MISVMKLVNNLGRAGQSLSQGQVATTTGTILDSVSVFTKVEFCRFFNTNAATQTLKVYITRSGGTRRQIDQQTIAQNVFYDLLASGEVFNLSPGDVLEADTTTTTALNYFISGEIESKAN